jgi:hypothetical protein
VAWSAARGGTGAATRDAVRRRAPRDANMRYPMGALGRGCSGFSPRRTARDQRRAIGSAGERLVHTEEVTGSIPVSPTQLTGQLRSCDRPFFSLVQQQSAAVTPGSLELRHTFVSLLSDNGMAIEEISRLVGHSSSNVTETIYRHQIRPVITVGAEAMDKIFANEQ